MLRTRGDAVDQALLDLVAEASAAGARTARSPCDSGTVKPIELSDDAWKIVETDRPFGVDRGERARGDAVHADHAFAGDHDDRLARQHRDRLDRIALQRLARGDFGAGLAGIQERSHVQRDSRAGDRDQRARMEDLRAVVRDFGGLAMMQLRNQPRIGDDAWIGGQDAGHVLPQHDTLRRQAIARARSR